MRFVKKIALFVMMPAVGISPAYAQTNPITGIINSQLVLTSGCAVDIGGGSANNGGVFGTLNFGSHPGTFTGSLSAQATGTGSTPTKITCTSDVSTVNITVGEGLNKGKGSTVGAGTRALGLAGSFIPYEVYADAAHANVYVIDTPQAVSVAVAGASFDLPIYGVANKAGAAALPPGAYIDTLSVTIGW